MSQNPYDPPKAPSEDHSGFANERPIKASRFETLEFVASALRMLAAVTEEKGEHSAEEFCRMVLQLAFDISNSDVSQTEVFLRGLNLTTSGDVGDALYELIDRGYAQANEKDRCSDFDNLFDFCCPPHGWKVCWIEDLELANIRRQLAPRHATQHHERTIHRLDFAIDRTLAFGR